MSERSLVCGIEIHQQLDTHKLFCECPGELSVSYTGEMVRRLRPTQSELGEIDRAALMEAQKKLLFRYMIPTTVCLVEQDEEPPHPVNPVALGTALLFSIMVHATPVDEVHYMRKIVVDGSNTAGFQRTALISQGGHVEVEGKKIGIQSICLEEDAARPIERKGGESVYNLDRLGIPLIEVATDPDIDSPEMARLVAEHIGMLLRATGKVRRGIGTIREDLNISIPGGARIETKGVQELRLISTYVKEEMARQERLLAAKEELLKRGGAIGEPVDVTTLLKDTGSKVLRRALDKGGVAMALELQGFAGLLGSYHDGKKCLGTELAGYAKTAGVGGLFHTDELPAYGVTQEEVDAIRDVMGLGAQDAFVLVADEPKRVGLAMERVIERAKMALKGVPEETRDPLQDGTTRYNRPLPGKARVYPETDIPPVLITEERLERLAESLPEMPWEKEERLVSEYRLSKEQSHQIVAEGVDGDLESVVKELKGMAPSFAATTMVAYADLPYSVRRDALARVNKGEVAKEAVAKILDDIRKKPGTTPEQAISDLDLGAVDEEEVKRRIEAIVAERIDLVKERGSGAVGPIMGIVMREFRGRVDGERLSQMVTEAMKGAAE